MLERRPGWTMQNDLLPHAVAADAVADVVVDVADVVVVVDVLLVLVVQVARW